MTVFEFGGSLFTEPLFDAGSPELWEEGAKTSEHYPGPIRIRQYID